MGLAIREIWEMSTEKAGLDLFSEHGTEISRKDIQGRVGKAEYWVYERNPGKVRPADSRVLRKSL